MKSFLSDKYNVGMRAVLKLLLNSFWGKFGQKDNKLMFKIITQVEEWLSLNNKRAVYSS